MLARLLNNHVFANLAFAVVLLLGVLSYSQLPREQDPTINFNWIDITTLMPGASAEDVEAQVTDVLEEAIQEIGDIRFVSSNSREGVSTILVRFLDIDPETFDKRLTDLRRELQNQESQLPAQAQAPRILEITSSNAFPSASLAVVGIADDENLRWQAAQIREDLARIRGVSTVTSVGQRDPELRVRIRPEALEGLQVTPTDVADTISRHYRDVAAGSVDVAGENWLVRLEGASADPGLLAALPVLTARGEVPLGMLADIERGRSRAASLARVDGQPAIMLAVFKQGEANLLRLVDDIGEYIDTRNRLAAGTGVRLMLIDDQTQVTRTALALMENNAAIGLLLVLLATWLFVGSRMALLTSIGIPFSLAATFWALAALGHTLNVTVLLGVVIALGMLVDDTVVVAEAIYFRLQRGAAIMDAVIGALREVAAPVGASVMTTMAAFMPLMLLPGILGQFMLVIPLVVTLALAASLVEAYWMLPAHALALPPDLQRGSRVQAARKALLRRVRTRYTQILIATMRRPRLALCAIALMAAGAGGAVASGMIRFDFFASDPLRLFYVNVDMPAGTRLDGTLRTLAEVEQHIREQLAPGEERAIISYAGRQFTETAVLFGEHLGQVMVSLAPEGERDADALIAASRAGVMATPGPTRLHFQRMAGGPPTARPISIKVRGDALPALRAGVADLKAILEADPLISDITDDDAPGVQELVLRIDHDAARRAGIDPGTIGRTLRLLADGEVVASLQHQGETLEVRVLGREGRLQAVDELLELTLPLTQGGRVALGALVHADVRQSRGNIRHYNFRRAITVEAEIDRTLTNTVEANRAVREAWDAIADRHPHVTLDFSGELDDIQESLDAIFGLFVFGVGLIYLILGTQFRSYFQPLMILLTVPLAFTGVVLGLLVTRDPLSLYTMYGVVALAGISVNAAIVLISAANDRLAAGMSLLHATLYAARRRVIPILITSLTTIAGLLSLATGLAGHSLIWSPVATAIVWGLTFSTLLTLITIPVLYRLSMGRAAAKRGGAAGRIS